MTIINSKELHGTNIDMAVVEKFEVWFRSMFGVRNAQSRDVLAHYIDLPDADAAVVEHLLYIQDLPSVVWDASMGHTDLLQLDKVLFIPRDTIVHCDVRVAGLMCSGGVEFRKTLLVNHYDIRVGGQLVIKEGLVCEAGCFAYTINIRNGSLSSKGDLIVERGIHVAKDLITLNHLKALYVQVGESVSLGGTVEVERGITSGQALAD